MSSNYVAICLSHNPALLIDGPDWQSGNGGMERAIHAVANRPNDQLAGHDRCDLVIGRMSYPLIEVCCMGDCPGNYHARNPRWIDADVLRLLWLGLNSMDPQLAKAATANHFRCWSRDRLSRLAAELALAPVAP